MVARVQTVVFAGIEVLDVDVQVRVSSGLPAFTVVGLPDKAVAESRERVRAALHAMGLALPPKRITVNLEPADLAKEGSHFDLPIALGLLTAIEALPADALDGYAALGELALDGALTPVAGVLPAAIHASAQERGLICPAAQGGEAAWAGELDVLAPTDLLALVNHFKGTQVLTPPEARLTEDTATYPYLADIKGQGSAKRALEIAAAGGHNMVMVGPPGAGKSMLAARLPGLLPPLDAAEALEVSMIHSLAGQLSEDGLVRRRPFRDPHHSASMPALVGGGPRARPGEVSLAHLGVLFLDELPEFSRNALDSLRQPLETGRANVARANAHVTYPARVQLVAAMNPCRCGYLDDPGQACTRAPKCAVEYQSRISGPMFDRIDLHVEVPAVRSGDLSLPPPAETSSDIAPRVAAARALQKARYGPLEATPPIRTNAEADGKLLEEVAGPDEAGRQLLAEASERMKLTARGYHRVLRVARTSADLEASRGVGRIHIAEALAYRRIVPGRSAVLMGGKDGWFPAPTRRFIRFDRGQGEAGRPGALSWQAATSGIFAARTWETAMAAIEWSNDLSVGVELIDSDHKTLIDLIKLVANSIEAGQTAKTIGDVVELLYEYTEFHFIREEVLMEDCGYSDLDNHRKVHQSLKKRARAIRDQYAKNPGSVDAPEILEFMTGWLTDHIMGQDMAYAPAMAGRFVHRTCLAS